MNIKKDIKMINLDSITNENNKMAMYAGPFIQSFENWWFWIRKKKHIT